MPGEVMTKSGSKRTMNDERKSETIAGALAAAARRLAQSGIDEPRRDAQILLARLIERDRTHLIVRADELLTDEAARRFRDAITRRAAGEPVQYITGRQKFFGLEFAVTPAVLIPRPETELVVEAALELSDAAESFLFCDVGTGSGCITIALLHHRPRGRAVAVDISPAALAVARMNAQRNNVEGRASFIASDVFDALRVDVPVDHASDDAANGMPERFAFIVSNPPYIDADEVPTLQREVREHEPQAALTPGADGLAVVRRLLADAPARLAPGGHLIFEIGYGQAPAVRALVDPETWRIVDVRADLQRIPRVFILKLRT